jgi:DNA-binding response OmpR family regulator
MAKNEPGMAEPRPHESRPKERVLVVEDDSSIALGLRINLEAEGYDVLLAEDGEAGLTLARTAAPDLVILDIMLPRLHGLEVLQRLRAERYSMPVILLSARAGEMDKVTGLELGAEDYVPKPFSLAELLARVRAHLRRGRTVASEDHVPPRDVVFEDFTVEVGARAVKKNGERVEMTATEFDVLLCMVESRGRVLTREAIFQRVWGPNHHGTPRTIDNFVQQLRAKLEPDPRKPKYFQTVRGVGYRFDA